MHGGGHSRGGLTHSFGRLDVAGRNRDDFCFADHPHRRTINDAYVEIGQRNELYRDRRRR